MRSPLVGAVHGRRRFRRIWESTFFVTLLYPTVNSCARCAKVFAGGMSLVPGGIVGIAGRMSLVVGGIVGTLRGLMSWEFEVLLGTGC